MADEEKDRERDEEQSEAGGAEKTPRKTGKIVRLLVGFILFVVVLILAAFVAYSVSQYFTGRDQKMAGSQGQLPGEMTSEPLMTFDMETFTIILEDEAGRTHNVKMHIFLAYDDAAVSRALADRKIELTSKINLLLLSQNIDDLRSPSGRTDLINQILKMVNDSLPYGSRIRDVYFTEYIVQ